VSKLAIRAVLAGGLLALGGQALALDKVDYVDLAKGDGIDVADGKIFVNPVNGDWGQAGSPAMTYHLRARAGCKGQNVIKELFVSLGSENVTKEALEASGNYRQTVPGQAYSKSIPWTTVEMKPPLAKLGFDPVGMCQAHLQQKMQQGATKQQVMAQDRILSKGVWFTAVARCGALGKSDDHYASKFIGAQLQVVCKAGTAGAGGNTIQAQPKLPPAAGRNLQAPFQVTAATFKATPKDLYASCPTKARFTGTLSASGPGTVQYRVLFPGSAKTGIRTLEFTEAGTRSIGLVEYPTAHSLPVATATLEVLSPGNRKARAHFKVQCVTEGAGGGSGGIQLQPQPRATPQGSTQRLQPSPPMQPRLRRTDR
jgi:hypothetical protein